MSDISFPPPTNAQYVTGSGSISIAQLLSSYPASTLTQGMYARVSDLYGSVDDVMRCRFDGTNYNWVPQREAFAGTTAMSTGAINLTPLLTPPTLRLTTTALTGNIIVNPVATNAYLGQRFRVITAPALNLGLFTAQVTGLIGSNVTLLAGTTKELEYGSTGWFQSA